MKKLSYIVFIILVATSCSKVFKNTKFKKSKLNNPTQVMGHFLDSMGYSYYNQHASLGLYFKHSKESGDSLNYYLEMPENREYFFWRNELSYNDRCTWGFGKGWRHEYAKGRNKAHKINYETAWKFQKEFEFYFKVVEGHFNKYSTDYPERKIISNKDGKVQLELKSDSKVALLTLDAQTLNPIEYSIRENGATVKVVVEEMGQYYHTPVRYPKKFKVYTDGNFSENVDVYMAVFNPEVKGALFNGPK